MWKDLGLAESSTLALDSLLINLLVGAVLALLITLHYKKFGSTLSNREELGRVFPILLLTTILIISVVKSSLALSLGLVGALSIVRFRTPIKEPEELTYLFVAIGAGLGLGANQTIPTCISVVVILFIATCFKLSSHRSENSHIFLSLDWIAEDSGSTEKTLPALNIILERNATSVNLRRFDIREGGAEATYLLDISNSQKLETLISELQNDIPNIGISYLDQKHMPSI